MRAAALILPLLLAAAPALAGPEGAAIDAGDATLRYPVTKRLDLVEDHFGVKVADPYRWLENDLRADPAVRDWVDRENSLTRRYLDDLPGRDALKGRIQALLSHGRFTVPRKAGGRYFYGYNRGLENQTPLYVREGLTGPQRLLLDPNGWAKDGASALAEWVPSPDGRTLAYAVQEAGSDWRTLQLIDVDSGKPLDDRVQWVKFSQIAWDGRAEGFFYSRFAAPQDGEAYQSANQNQQLYYHRVGTDQAQDQLIYDTPDRPALSHQAQVTSDGRWLLISSFQGIDPRRELHVAELTGGPVKPRLLVKGPAHDWRLIGSRGASLYFLTDDHAAHMRVVTLEATRPRSRPKEVVGERPETLAGGSLVGNRMILAYMSDAQTVAELVELDGRKVTDVPLPGMGTAAGFGGREGDPETFFSFSGFVTPASIYRFDTTSLKSELFAQPDLPFNPDDFGVEQRLYPSRDGTLIPMTVIRRKTLADQAIAAPTILYGYGGFNISLTPGYSATRMAWLEQGGVYAIANLRGGGEYGKAWHEAGRGANKQNVFDDFIAAAEYLKANGFTTKDGLAIEGRSNGGLLVGAVVNQRPDLFAAALPAVGVMDMLRFDRFTAGRYWVDDYGSPEKAADFPLLYGYSPYHNILGGKAYPAILVSTADTDDRVVPAHSFKYAAALQAADLGARPRLLRVETRAGHGSGKPVDKLIEEYADSYSFAAYFTGLKIRAKPN
ncbi:MULTISPECIES: prolyl oligopeptidase family serine peptidase [Sphingobium]|jgi:prolyl oligopeptidase|uniref:prolyl oligopeptidase family serine peptidase n=1 Tax=Sphingobium TaxID=165695 RepID=UPI000DBB1A21|nr:prolyl oligopeptidase family serine peptidase [Sphingobium sp. YG1]MBU0930747.1 prolyl oligopeptidase family serine peptidase [Alphaproteobacteria bacterium]BBD00948.1 prolyl oligopeptidase [Sphingobium sp. YG1]